MVSFNTLAPQSFSSRLSTSVNITTIQQANLKQKTDAAKLADTAAKPVVSTDGGQEDHVAKLFAKFDLDNSGRISREEATKVLKEYGGLKSDEATDLLNKYFSHASDLDGDGLSLTELRRTIAIQNGDAFAAGDLNSDGYITSQEVDQALEIYSALGTTHEKKARADFKAADADGNGILSKTEYNTYLQKIYAADNQPVTEDTRLRKIFNSFDINNDGEVTREEVFEAVKRNGGTEDEAQKIINEYFRATTDVDGNDKISFTEAARHIKIAQGNTFALGDLNNDGVTTTDELNEAIDLYKRTGHKFDEAEVREYFKNADANKDGNLSRAEFDRYEAERYAPTDPADKPDTQDKPVLDKAYYHQLFKNTDTNNDGLVTRDEILAAVKKTGVSAEYANYIADEVLAANNDIDGNGLSIQELNRRLAIDDGDAFAAGDLNSDGKITSEELEKAISLYQKYEGHIDADDVRKAVANADTNKDGILTRAEFNNYDPDKPIVTGPADKPVLDREFYHKLFKNTDTNGDGLVTRNEILAAIKKSGVNVEYANSIADEILGPNNDIDGNGLSIQELNRRLAIDSGDVFAAGDLNSDGKITAEELEKAIPLYQKFEGALDAADARKFFKAADANKDGSLTRAEFDSYDPDNPVSTEPGKPSAGTPANIFDTAKAIFNDVDANKDGLVTKEEVFTAVKKAGGSDDEAQALVDEYFASTTDVNKDGKVSFAEVSRHIKISLGDSFALGDLNDDGIITAAEAKEAVNIYKSAGHKVDEGEVKEFFATADTNKNGAVNRNEFDAYNRKIAAENQTKAPADVELAAQVKPHIGQSIATLDSQLVLLLQDQA